MKIVDGSHNPPPKTSRGKLMLSARNIENNKLNLEAGYRFISETDFKKEHNRTRLADGDVLLTIVGTIGRSLVVDEMFPEATLQRSVAAIRVPVILPKFLSYQFQSPAFQTYLASVARGTAQKGVYLKTLGESDVILAPLPEQRRIVDAIESYFSRLDSVERSVGVTLEKVTRLRCSILARAFEGWLVEQDLHDEPASALLDRIRAARKGSGK